MRTSVAVLTTFAGAFLLVPAVAHAGTGATGSPILVAVEQGASSSGAASLVAAQLNDDTYFDFTATVVTATQIDSAAELASYQVVVHGASGYGADYDWTSTMATAQKTWVSGGGGVVSTGWIDYAITTSTTGGIGSDMDDLTPIDAYPDSTNWFCYGGLSVSISSTSHPVTTGITSVSTSSADIEISPYTPDATGGTVLGTANGSSCSSSTKNAVVVGTYGSGREVYLGLLYGASSSGYATSDLRSGNADRLLEQAVAWAAYATGSYTYYKDADGDGYGNSAISTTSSSSTAPSGYTSDKTDCDDTSSSIHPGATETCNSKDDDCDGLTDEGVTTTYYKDADGDGYGVTTTTTTGCSKPSGYSSVSTDCDDTNASISPAATEICNSKDDDCDGLTDEGVSTTYYKDADGDGYGVTTSTTTGCSRPSGYSTVSTDCDDTKSAVNPGATEICNSVDDDCDGLTDEGVKTTYYKDADGDSYGVSTSTTTGCSKPSGYSTVSTDCDDTKSTVYPGAPESCNGVDDDCDGTIDNGVKTTYYKDADGDGYGLSTSSTTACSAPSGYVSDKTDCNDSSPTVHPGATETCNSVDDDCDGLTDEGVTTTYYKDADGDGYGDKTSTTTGCSAPSGYVSTSTDCDDTRKTVYPGAAETCDSIDDDCDGLVDEGVTTTYYKDADGDGYGVSTSTTTGCSKPAGYSTLSTDCDDAKSSVNPGATETCNSVDDDCDGLTDEGVTTTYYKDADGDGYGVSTSTSSGCSKPSGYSSLSTDCDDTKASVNPGATETCDSIDDDCDGLVDEGLSVTYYKDGDADGYGDATKTKSACSLPSGYTTDKTDCDDATATTHPGASETCNGVDDDCNGTIDDGVKLTYYKDADGDGYGLSTSSTTACSAPVGYVSDKTDCNDGSPTVHPGATETCNSVDDDCDGLTDEGATTTYYKDADGDGYGDATKTTTGCSAPSGYVADKTDCDDTRKTVNPAAAETCDSLDDDCDGAVDEGVTTTYYRDADGDGYGASATSTSGCSAPTGYVADKTDCDDTRSTVHPGATETCDSLDDDCDGLTDEGVTTTYYKDADGDGYGDATKTSAGCSAPTGYVADKTDCNDAASTVHPGASETCNGVDDDCNGTIDDGVKLTYYRDADGDGYGTSATSTTACSAPSGYVSDKTDCDDAAPTVHPGASETCDSLDDDCDGLVDEGVTTTYYKDADGDGYGDATRTATGCTAPTGYVADKTDCDDTRTTVNPTAAETCDGLDDDCDGSIDEGVTTTYYRDADGDGYGSSATSTSGCSAPAGYVADKTDCDDARSAVHPGATETCDGLDDDCDGLTDEGVKTTWYADADGDGYGAAATSTDACSAPSGYVASSTDCDDTRATVHPGATETCNGLDDDCDASVDEGVKSTWYRDADGDGYGDATVATAACSAPTGYVADKTDCDDTRAIVYPGATEVCDGLDDDCDGLTDEGVKSTWYRDADGDGYGTSTTTSSSCTAPSGYVADKTDCDDTLATVNPGASETCDGLDDDCDGSVDEGVTTTYYRDGDSDGYGDAGKTKAGCSAPTGYVASATDCDDTRSAVHPGATEYCNGRDDDCDGTTDEDTAVDASTWYRDGDGDGYGDPASSAAGCSAPSGFVSDASDCDDAASTVHPGAAEVCDGVDQDCDGSVDEGVTTTYYADADKDGYGDLGSTTQACSVPTGYTTDTTDCDDTRATVHPGATETCDGVDQDCDGTVDDSAIDASTWYADADADGYGAAASTAKGCTAPSGYVADKTDCDDARSTVHPGATETCDGLDDDCDGGVDEGVTTVYYADADADGYGDPATTTAACSAPSGYTLDSADCDDGDATISPAADELCDGYDDDCDGQVDEADAIDAPSWYDDADLDGYGDAGSPSVACDAPAGTVADDTDCDDGDDTIHPGAPETCDGVDQDCDGAIDDGATDGATWYADDDGDGYGDAATSTVACSQPAGTVADGTDCDDGSASVWPGATETCDGVDDDCDGTVDEPDAADASTWYADADKDGYGDAGSTQPGCTAPTGTVADATDCDDGAASVHPGASETCDGVDDDCDGTVDESDAVDAATWHADADADGYGDPASTSKGCSAPVGTVADATDCDDTDAGRYPGAAETPYDGIDQDCDGADLVDVDGDGVVASAAGGTDCDDRDATIYPGAAETADGRDSDCDGTVDEGTDWSDDDGDGVTEAGGDCDDADATVGPSATETCDGKDQDCDGVADNGTSCYDDDGDGVTEDGGDCNDGDAARSPSNAEISDNGIDDDCDGVVDDGLYDADHDGYTEDGGDCGPDDGATYPGAPEVEDGVDNDCDGEVDEGTDAYDDDGDGFSEEDGDCDDGDAAVAPDATEITDNGVDDDCDGAVDEGGVADDYDGDGYTETEGDCDDRNDSVYPGAPEYENGADDDCDGEVDEDYIDADDDGYTVQDGDCDDDNGWISPRVGEMCDGLDNDCDGSIDEDAGCDETQAITSTKTGGCGCDGSGGAASGWLAVGLVALALRRRHA